MENLGGFVEGLRCGPTRRCLFLIAKESGCVPVVVLLLDDSVTLNRVATIEAMKSFR